MIMLADKGTRLFLDATWHCGEVPNWIQIIPGPGTWKHPQWGDITITNKVLREFAANFKAAIYQGEIPIDAEHETKLSGAVGYYSKVKVGGPKGEPGLWARIEWNERGQKLLEEERYKYFSPEWYDTWTDPATSKTYQHVLIGGALTTRPFFKDKSLKPLVATEGYLWRVLSEEGTEQWEELEKVAHNEADPSKAPKKKTGGRNTMGELALKLTGEQAAAIVAGADIEFSEEQLAEVKASMAPPTKATEVPPDVAKRLSELEVKNKHLEDQAKAATERVAAMEKAGRRREFTEFVRVNREAFDGEVDAIVDQLEKFSDSLNAEDFAAYRRDMELNAKRLRESGLFSQRAKEGVAPSVEDELNARIKSLTDGGMNIGEATAKVAREDPALYKRYDKEQHRKAAQGGE